MAKELKKLINEYEEGRVSRREFMRQAVMITGSLAAANSLIGGLLYLGSDAAQVAPNDPGRPDSQRHIRRKNWAGVWLSGSPDESRTIPGVIVIHENAGLSDHVRDVARRFAKEGYVALAPDFLSRQGGTPKANPQGVGLPNIRELAPVARRRRRCRRGIRYLRVLPDVRRDRIGVVGFCWGGGMAFVTATQIR